jgi:hypothetical protein
MRFSCWKTPSAISTKLTPQPATVSWATSWLMADSSTGIGWRNVEASPASVKSYMRCAPASSITQ